FEKITVKWLSLVAVALFQGLRDFLPNRTAPGAIRILPGQAILFPGRADDLLGVLIDLGIVMLFRGIFMLGLDKAAANSDCVQFVRADTSQQDFVVAGFRIEIPFPISLHDRNG